MLYDVFLPEFFKGIVKDLKKKYRSVSEDLKIALRLVVNNPELGKTLRVSGMLRNSGFEIQTLEKGKEADTD